MIDRPKRECETGAGPRRLRTVVVTTHDRLASRPMIVPADGTMAVVFRRYPDDPTELQVILGVRGSTAPKSTWHRPYSDGTRHRKIYKEYDGSARPAPEWYPPHPADPGCACQYWRGYMWATQPVTAPAA